MLQVRVETDPSDRTQMRLTVASEDANTTYEYVHSTFIILHFLNSKLVKYIHSAVLFMNFMNSVIVVEVCTKWDYKHQTVNIMCFFSNLWAVDILLN